MGVLLYVGISFIFCRESLLFQFFYCRIAYSFGKWHSYYVGKIGETEEFWICRTLFLTRTQEIEKMLCWGKRDEQRGREVLTQNTEVRGNTNSDSPLRGRSPYRARRLTASAFRWLRSRSAPLCPLHWRTPTPLAPLGDLTIYIYKCMFAVSIL